MAMGTVRQQVHELARKAREKQIAVQTALNALQHLANTQPFTADQRDALRTAYRLINTTTTNR